MGRGANVAVPNKAMMIGKEVNVKAREPWFMCREWKQASFCRVTKLRFWDLSPEVLLPSRFAVTPMVRSLNNTTRKRREVAWRYQLGRW